MVYYGYTWMLFTFLYVYVLDNSFITLAIFSPESTILYVYVIDNTFITLAIFSPESTLFNLYSQRMGH